jgi:hypothetical protein
MRDYGEMDCGCTAYAFGKPAPVPARSPVDDALDRLEANEPEYASDAATVREALERLREERDEYKRAHEVTAGFANDKLIPRAVAAEAETKNWKESYENALSAASQIREQWNQETAELETLRIENLDRALAAETEVRQLREAQSSLLAEQVRLTEGLRERDEIIDCLLQRGHFDPFVPLAAFRKIVPKGTYSVETYDEEKEWLARIEARALLAASPTEHPDEKMRRYMEGDPFRSASPTDGGGA